jgi:hypothetical protein
MKKIFLLTAAMMFSACLFAQGITGRGASDDITDAETFEAEKTKTEIIIPKDFHSKDTSASVKIEYSPMYDEVRIYYECMYVTYDRGEAMNTVLEVLADSVELLTPQLGCGNYHVVQTVLRLDTAKAVKKDV